MAKNKFCIELLTVSMSSLTGSILMMDEAGGAGAGGGGGPPPPPRLLLAALLLGGGGGNGGNHEHQHSTTSSLSYDGAADAAVHSNDSISSMIFIETFYTSLKGANIARCFGTISALCSFLIIAIIWRSPKRFASIYHRFIFGIGIFDMIGSISMALSSLPLPTDMIYSQFQGRYIGTVVTCEVQGLLVNITRLSTLAYHVALYCCFLRQVRLKLSPTTRKSLEDNSSISKSYYELITHFICIVVPIAAVTPFLPMGYINPSPFLPWCNIVQYPFWCNVNSREDCFLRGYEYRKFFFTYGGIIYSLLYMVGILTLIILTGFIVISFYQSQRQARLTAAEQQQNHFVKILLPCKKSQSSSSAAFFMNVNASTSNEENDQKRLASSSDENHESTRHIANSHHHEQESEISPCMTLMHYGDFKRIVVQSCAYLVVLLITNCAGLILRTFSSGNNHTMQLLHILFLSLEGFFTFIVFLSDKAYRQYQRFAPRKSNPSIAGGLDILECFPTKRRPQEDEDVEVYFMNEPISALDLEPSQTIRKLHNNKEEEEGLEEEGSNTSTITAVRPCDLSFPVPSVELQRCNDNIISNSNFPLLLGMVSVEESDSNSISDSSSISFPSSITSDPSCTLSDASILEDIDTSPTFTKKIDYNSSFYQNVRENLKKQCHTNYALTPAGERDKSDYGDTIKSSDDEQQAVLLVQQQQQQQQNREPCRIPSSLDLSTIAEERSLQSLQSCPDFVV